MSEVFLYSKAEEIGINSDDLPVEFTVFKAKWLRFTIFGQSFTVTTPNTVNTYTLPNSGRYAIYRGEVISISESHKKVLLISDLDHTLISNDEHIMAIYYNFIKFWIEFCEFNDSVLIYNTGRNIPQYNSVKPKLFEPDLLIGVVGNVAFTFDELGNEIEEAGYTKMINEIKDKDWDINILIHELEDQFEQLRIYDKHFSYKSVYFMVPNKIYESIKNDVKIFVRNSAKVERSGRCMAGQVMTTKKFDKDRYFVDIHPKTSGKHLAVQYGQMKFGFDNENTIVAGDSLNDEDALKWPCLGVIVANSEEHLLNWFHKKHRPHKYISQLSYANAVKEAVSLALGMQIN
jgi:sucrose-6-phosphatase